MAIVDIHEPESIKQVLLAAGWEVKALTVADYVVGNVAFERKAIADLIGSYESGRLDTQLSNMTGYDLKVLILEGDYDKYATDCIVNKIKPTPKSTIVKMLASAMARHKACAIVTKDLEETGVFLLHYSSRIEAPDRVQSAVISKENMDGKDIRYAMLRQINGLSGKVIESLIDKGYGLTDIAQVSDETLLEIDGIGAGTVKKLKTVLNQVL